MLGCSDCQYSAHTRMLATLPGGCIVLRLTSAGTHPCRGAVPYLGAQGAVVHRHAGASVVGHEGERVVQGVLFPDFVARGRSVLDGEEDVCGGEADGDGGRDGVHHQASYQGYKDDVPVVPFSGRRDTNRHGRFLEAPLKSNNRHGDDGEHTRFPCLVMVRYVVAAAVTMLTVAVIMLVIHAVLRSEDVHLSVNNGYIGADSLAIVHYARPDPDLAGPDSPDDYYDYVNGPLPKECFLGCSGGGEGGHRQPATQFTLHKASTTNLRVILISSNPSGRTKIDCSSTTVSLIDMQSPYKQIGPTLTLKNFTVLPQTTITMQQRLKITDTTYIWDNYGGEVRFSVKMQVSATVTSFPLGKPHTKQQNYTCQPVTVGLIDDEASFATDQVDCRAS
ncbi:hypothetical protein EJB05_05366, partial [Eragrostis curvula]